MTKGTKTKPALSRLPGTDHFFGAFRNEREAPFPIEKPVIKIDPEAKVLKVLKELASPYPIDDHDKLSRILAQCVNIRPEVQRYLLKHGICVDVLAVHPNTAKEIQLAIIERGAPLARVVVAHTRNEEVQHTVVAKSVLDPFYSRLLETMITRNVTLYNTVKHAITAAMNGKTIPKWANEAAAEKEAVQKELEGETDSWEEQRTKVAAAVSSGDILVNAEPDGHGSESAEPAAPSAAEREKPKRQRREKYPIPTAALLNADFIVAVATALEKQAGKHFKKISVLDSKPVSFVWEGKSYTINMTAFLNKLARNEEEIGSVGKAKKYVRILLQQGRGESEEAARGNKRNSRLAECFSSEEFLASMVTALQRATSKPINKIAVNNNQKAEIEWNGRTYAISMFSFTSRYSRYMGVQTLGAVKSMLVRLANEKGIAEKPPEKAKEMQVGRRLDAAISAFRKVKGEEALQEFLRNALSSANRDRGS